MYCDTDSCGLALTETGKLRDNMNEEERIEAVYGNLIKPEMRQSWNSNYKKWFVTTNEPEDVRFPGRLKESFYSSLIFSKNFKIKLEKTEFEFSNGRFIGLCPKTYLG